MDLATAPALFKAAPPAVPEIGAQEAVLLISTENARDRQFVKAWENLAAAASEPNPFFEPWFVLPSFNAFPESTKINLFAHFTNGELTGLMPIGRTANYYGYPVPHTAGWQHDNAFCGAPLVACGRERSFWRTLLSHLDEVTTFDLFLHMPRLSCDGTLYPALKAVLAEEARPSYISFEESRAMVATNLSSEEYFQSSMSTKKRKELRRQHKRLSEEGLLEFVRCDDAVDIDKWIADFVALEAAGWKGKAGSALGSAPETHQFFAETLKAAADAGKLERLTLNLDGWPIAMLANFISPPGVFSFKTTFDEAFARFSPGMLLQLENLSLVDREDIDWADSCAAEGHPMIERLWREKRTLKSHNVAIGGAPRRAVFKRLMAYETRNRSAA
ncbi:MAG: GNAT family N-acetyltransferase [Pseudomonadota bacterium]